MVLRYTAVLLTFLLVSSPVLAQFWEETSGPPASVTCMITNSDGHVFAGTPFSAVYRTTDNGETWERKDKGIDDGGPNFFPVNSLALGVNDEIFAAVNGLGLLRSRDNGENWTKLDIDLDIAPNSRLSVSTEDLGNGSAGVFVSYDAGAANLHLRFSDNSGESFVEIPKSNLPSAMSSIFETFLSPNSDKMFILVSYNKGLYRSSNMGQNWTRIDSDPSSGESDDNFLTMRAAPNGTLYIGRNALASSSKSKNAVVMRSTNDGESWEYLLEGWDNRDVTNNQVLGIAFGPGNDVWAITKNTSGVFYSSNGGDNWISRNEGLPGDGSGSGVAVTKDGHVFVAPTGASVHRHMATVSVEEATPHVVRNVKLAPNPTRDRIFVTVDLDHDAMVQIELVSSQGVVVAQPMQRMMSAGQHTVTFPTNGLSSGAYVWVVRSGADVRTGTLHIVR